MVGKFRLQLHGSELIFMKLHGSRLTFLPARLLVAMFLLLRVPYWLAMAILHKNESKKSMETAKAYLSGAVYCIAGWKNMLINKDVVEKML
jgi:hypothetical protein